MSIPHKIQVILILRCTAMTDLKPLSSLKYITAFTNVLQSYTTLSHFQNEIWHVINLFKHLVLITFAIMLEGENTMYLHTY